MLLKLQSFFKNNYFVLIATAIAAFLSFFMIGSKSYWFDEAFTITVTRNFSEMVQILKIEEAKTRKGRVEKGGEG